MRHLFSLCLLVTMVSTAYCAAAVTVVECVDAAGNSSFRDQCPPGMSKKGEKQLTGLGGQKSPTMAEIASKNPVTLYTVPNCDACDLVRNALKSRKVPFKEKNVQDNAKAQEELKKVSGGLTVPATVIGSNVLTGYSRDAVMGGLDQAGYPPADENSAGEAPASEPPAAEK